MALMSKLRAALIALPCETSDTATGTLERVVLPSPLRALSGDWPWAAVFGAVAAASALTLFAVHAPVAHAHVVDQGEVALLPVDQVGVLEHVLEEGALFLVAPFDILALRVAQVPDVVGAVGVFTAAGTK